MEIWKKITCLKEANGTYYASNLGRIKNQSGQILRLTKREDGYLKKSFYIGMVNGKKKYEHMLVHRVIYFTFFDDYDEENFVFHINKDKTDNSICNLSLKKYINC